MDQIRSMLQASPCVVKFTKADGSIRDMLCTLHSDYINYKTAGKSKPDPEGMYTVWDIESDGWRRFNANKVISIEEVQEET